MKKIWNKIKKFFKDSETIFWARFQVFGAAVAASWTYFMNDSTVQEAIKSLINPKYLPFYVIGAFAVNGVITEWLRKRRDNL